MPLKIIAGVIVLQCFISALRNTLKDNIIKEKHEYRLRLDFILLCFGLLALSYAALFWGYGFLNDWSKHRSVLLSLYYSPFNPKLKGFIPPLEDSLRNAQLVYYYGMHLPAACAVKLMTSVVKISNLKSLVWNLSFAFFFWNMIGLILAFLLIPVGCKNMFGKSKDSTTWGSSYFAIIGFAGLNYWERALATKRVYAGHAEWSTTPFAQFSSFISLWQWVPSQLITGLLGITFIFVCKDKFKRFPLCLLGVFLISGSAWCWIGALPIIAYFLREQYFANRERNFIKRITDFFREMKVELITSIFITSIVIFFYTSSRYPVTFKLNAGLIAGTGLLRYLLFMLIELLPAGIILGIYFLKKRFLPPIVMLSLYILVLLPFLNVGRYNDLVMRGSIPALCIIMMFCGLVVQRTIIHGSVIEKVFIAIFFLAITPLFLNEYVVGLKGRCPRWLEYRAWSAKKYVGTGNTLRYFHFGGGDR